MEIDFFTFFVILTIFVFLIGLSVGSFLNLAAYRIPLGISLFLPRSHCPHCKKKISIYALIPVFSYFLIRGRCEYCYHKISLQYPVVEFITALCTTILFLWYFNSQTMSVLILNSNSLLFEKTFFLHKVIPFFASLWLLYTGLVLSVIDIKYRILPDVIVLPGIIIGFFISVLNPQIGCFDSLLGIFMGAGGLFIISKIYEIIRKQEGIGMGDVKYLGFLGAIVGWKGILVTLVIASILGSFYGLILGFLTKKGLKTTLPFGPFLALGAMITFIYG